MNSKSLIKQKFATGIAVLFAHLPSAEKTLHFIVIFWVLWQLISSSLMHVDGDTLWPQIELLAKIHAFSGVGLMVIALVFFIKVVTRRKLTDLYPWLYRNFSVIKADLYCLARLQLPEPKPAGLAATVEGLGLLALLLAVCSGFIWLLVAYFYGSAALLLDVHKTSVGAIEAYFYAHGGLAILHFIVWWRKAH